MVTLEIKKDSGGGYRFYLRNSDLGPVSEIRIINDELKCRFSDKSWKSEEGTDEYILNFSEKPSLNAQEKEEVSPRLKIAGKGLCDVRNIEITPLKGSYDTPAEITICYKKGEQKYETKMSVSWSGKYKILSGTEPTDQNGQSLKKTTESVSGRSKKSLFSHWLTQGLIITVGGGVILLFIQHGCFHGDSNEHPPKTKNIPEHCPATTLEVSQLADRALWEGTQECGDRAVYKKLQTCFEQVGDPELKSEYANQIERIKSDYQTSILGPRARATSSVCKLGTMQGDRCEIEPEKGFLAHNVIDHLDRSKYSRCTSRLRAAALLENIDTAKGEKDMKKAIGLLVSILEDDPSLLVSKLALDRYSQFTGYSPLDVFDFNGALKDWEKRKEEILRKLSKID